jgi:hypothetical protein
MRRSIKAAFEDQVATLRHLVQAQAEQFEAPGSWSGMRPMRCDFRALERWTAVSGTQVYTTAGRVERPPVRVSSPRPPNHPHAVVRNRLSQGLLVLAAVTFRSRRAPSPSTGFPLRAHVLQST